MRVFICLEMPARVKDQIRELQSQLQSYKGNVSWTRPENIHLTLKFLGEITEEQARQVSAVTQALGPQFDRFTLTVTGTGAFPGPQRPRVLWVGLQGDLERLAQLQQRLDQALHTIGFSLEDRPFKPHLTIGRVRTPQGIRPVVDALTGFTLASHQFPVDQIVVMRSQLQSGGSIYTPLEIARFNSDQPIE